MKSNTIAHPKVVSLEEWFAERKALLADEKHSLNRDHVNAKHRRLPMVKMDKEYVFKNLSGKTSLFELFEGRRQPIVYHFMFGPAWDEGCSGLARFRKRPGDLAMLNARDTTLFSFPEHR